MTLNKNKNGMDMFTYAPSLTLTLRFSLSALEERGRGSAESSKHKTSLLQHRGKGGGGVSRLDTQGRGHLNTIITDYTKPSIWRRSLGNTSSALQGKSLTALILAGNSPQLGALLYR